MTEFNFDKLDKAIIILMKQKNYIWCDICQDWVIGIKFKNHLEEEHC